MKTRQIFGYIAVFLLLALSIESALALTASIGNARMILYPNMVEGESTVVERTIEINNVNDVPVGVSLQPMGDIENITEILDNDLELQPNETVYARFRITVPEPKRYDGGIGVKFYENTSDKDKGVGLMSTIILLAEINQTQPTNPRVNRTTTSQTETQPAEGPSVPVWAIGVAVLLILVIAAVIVVSNKKKGEKSAKKSRKTRK